MSLKPREAEALTALDHGRYDIAAFSREVLGIEPNPAQARWFRWINPAENGWSWRFKTVIHVAANQIGKTVAIAILILWACSYKMGVPHPDKGASEKEYRDWISRPYQWFHLAPTQQTAYLTLDDILLISRGDHIAQAKGEELGLKCRWMPGLVQEVKIEQYYRGLSFWNGATCQFRTTDDQAKALQGRRAAGITFDEAGLENNLKWVVNTVLLLRLIAMNGPLFLIGTPNGINDYYDFVEAITLHGEEKPWPGYATEHNPEERVWVRDDDVVCWSHVIDNIGYGLTQEAVDVLENGGLDEASKEQALRGAFLAPAEAFFVPQAPVLRAFKRQLPNLVPPKPGHHYVIFVDPSLASDPTAMVVLDITPGKLPNGDPRPWVGVALKHYRKPLPITELIQEIWATHLLYNGAIDPNGLKSRSQAVTGFDSTAMGGQAIKQMLVGLAPLVPVNFGGPTAKTEMLTNLRAVLSKNQLWLPEDWNAARREIANYRLADQKLQQDIVMALAGAAKIASRGVPGTSHAFRPQGRVSVSPLR